LLQFKTSSADGISLEGLCLLELVADGVLDGSDVVLHRIVAGMRQVQEVPLSPSEGTSGLRTSTFPCFSGEVVTFVIQRRQASPLSISFDGAYLTQHDS
jgi:hypothetical protein